MAEEWVKISGDNSNSGGYEEIESWRYWETGKGANVQGELIDIKHNIGKDNNTIWTFMQDSGEKINIWGGVYALDKNLSKLAIGDRVKIVYGGKEKHAKDPKKTVHVFDIYASKAGGGAQKAQVDNKAKDEVNVDDIPF